MAINQRELERNWDTIKQQLHSRWDQVSTEELERTRGDVEQMIGVIQHQSGTGRRMVEQYLEELTSTSSRTADAFEAVREQATAAQTAIQQQVQQAGASLRTGYVRTGAKIQQRPLESTLICFSAGLVTGLLLSRSLCSR